MVRDTMKSFSFWKESLQHLKLQLEKYESLLENEKNENKIERYERRFYHVNLCYLVSQYSGGETQDTLKDSFSKCLQIMSKIWTPDNSYTEMLWMCSLGVLLGADDKDIQLLNGIYKKYDKEDSVISFLMNYLNPCIQKSEDIIFDVPYEILLPITSGRNSTEAVQILREYLDRWYEGHNDTWWYDSDQTNDYIGYWSFESAAIAKILKLDENRLTDKKFFPVF